MTPWKIGSVRGPGQQAHFEEPENVEPVTVMVKVEAKPLATTSYCPLTSEPRLRSTCLGVTAFGITQQTGSSSSPKPRARHAAVGRAAELTDEILHHGDARGVLRHRPGARRFIRHGRRATAIGGGATTGAPAAWPAK